MLNVCFSKLKVSLVIVGFLTAFVSNGVFGNTPMDEVILNGFYSSTVQNCTTNSAGELNPHFSPTDIPNINCFDTESAYPNIVAQSKESIQSTEIVEFIEELNPDCMVNIDFVFVSDCIDAFGYADMTVGGFTNKEVVTVEVMVDNVLYFFDGAVTNGFWISNFEMQGSSISYVAAHSGNSETGCSDYEYEVLDIPSLSCDDDETDFLKFYDNSTPFCNPAAAEVKVYQIGTSILKHILTADYNESTQSYIIANPPIGTFDVFIKPLGCLQQGFEGVVIESGPNTITIDELQKGDINDSNTINIIDVSLLSIAFNSSSGDSNYILQADFNCSGSINISDVSIFGLNFDEVGDEPPFFEP